MTFPLRDVAAVVKTVLACESRAAAGTDQAPSLITAGGGLDNLKFTGRTIDRKSGSAICHSAELCTGANAALGAAETVTLAHELQESADGTNWDTAEVIEAATTYLTAVGAANYSGAARFAIDLMKRKRYVRFNVTANMSRANTDTMLFVTHAVLGGWTQAPQS